MTRLRAASEHKSHHLSTFRSGFAIGLALPVLASGIYRSKVALHFMVLYSDPPSDSKASSPQEEQRFQHGISYCLSTPFY
jgi:hypothetical protein